VWSKHKANKNACFILPFRSRRAKLDSEIFFVLSQNVGDIAHKKNITLSKRVVQLVRLNCLYICHYILLSCDIELLDRQCTGRTVHIL
jgi:hypothetical protein